jgi:hypothetical protein
VREAIILAAPEGWYRFGPEGGVDPIAPFPELEQPARVVVVFEEPHIDTLRFQGKPQYAPAIIERQIRQEGWIESSAHVEVHALSRVKGGGVAFYTAVELDSWQRVTEWARAQRHHCLIYPSASLLAHCRRGQGRALRVGRQIRVFARAANGLVTEEAYCPSDDPEDLRFAVFSLGDELAERLGSHGGGGLALEWIAAQTSDVDTEQALCDALAERSGLSVSLVTMSDCGRDGDSEVTGLPDVVSRLPVRASANTALEKAAWWPEALAVPALASMLLLAGILGGLGWYFNDRAAAKRAEAQEVVAELRRRQSEFESVPIAERHQQLQDVGSLISAFERTARYAPEPLLEDLREASGEELLVQRVMLEKAADNKYHLRVDGRDRSSDNLATRRFLTTLQSRGWDTTPLEPAADQPGSLSYRLTPMEVSP